MPHMMPMLWIMIYIFTLTLLMIIISLLYFFYLPPPIFKPYKSHLNLPMKKWTWLW